MICNSNWKYNNQFLISDEQITTDDNPAYNIHTVSGINKCFVKWHVIQVKYITRPNFNLTGERITTDENLSYSIHSVSGIVTGLVFNDENVMYYFCFNLTGEYSTDDYI